MTAAASLAVAAAPAARPGIEVLAVLGGAGASVTAHLIAQALAPELRCGLAGSLGIGFPGELRAQTEGGLADADDPLAHLERRGARAAVIELAPDGARTPDPHALAARHGVLDAIGHGASAAVRRLIQTPGLDWLIVGADARVDWDAIGPLPRDLRIASIGGGPMIPPPRRDLWVRARGCDYHERGQTLSLESSLGPGVLESTLLGTAQTQRLLAVLALMLARGLPLERACNELSRVRCVPGRMESFGGNGAPLVVVDHARRPEALEQALTNLRRHGARRVITVLGCKGERERGQRPRVGALALRLSDALILTDDDPRGEDGSAIIADILEGLPKPLPAEVRVERQRGLAIRRAIALAGRGDAVLVAGKGHGHTQDLGELRVHFSDRAQVVEALREWREGHH